VPSILSRTGWARARRKRTALSPSRRAALEQHVAYYRVLPSEEQREVRGLVQVLLGEWTFEAGAGLEGVDEMMRVLIAAQAAILFLHRPLSDLPALRTVIVYPGAYHVRERTHTEEGVEVEANEERLGEAWSHGTLLLSWDDVLYDSTHIDDAHNVVFHEVAHALDDQTGESDGMPLLADSEAVETWSQAFGRAFEGLERGLRRRQRTALDPYAAEDPSEFFAVATEAFMEQPQQFQAAYPELYGLLREFYHLDPLRWSAQLKDVSPDRPPRRGRSRRT
jgi:Mlc titration factor MtfA (ptsG expression regulator)